MVVIREPSSWIRGHAAFEDAILSDNPSVRMAFSGPCVNDIKPPTVQILARRRGGMCRGTKCSNMMSGWTARLDVNGGQPRERIDAQIVQCNGCALRRIFESSCGGCGILSWHSCKCHFCGTDTVGTPERRSKWGSPDQSQSRATYRHSSIPIYHSPHASERALHTRNMDDETWSLCRSSKTLSWHHS